MASDVQKSDKVIYTLRRRCFPGTISVKFYAEARRWLRCTALKKYRRKLQPLS